MKKKLLKCIIIMVQDGRHKEGISEKIEEEMDIIKILIIIINSINEDI